MATRIKDAVKDIAKINSEFERTDKLEERLKQLEARLEQVNKERIETADRDATTHINNINFAWDGPNLKLTWVVGYVKNAAGKIYQVPAGEITGLTASTHYWMAWNPEHQQMSAQTSIEPFVGKKNFIVICNLHTGAAGAAASAGGGGSAWGSGASTPGDDLGETKYSLI